MPSKILSRDLELGGGELLQNGVVIVDSNGNIDAPVTTTSLTLSGSATVGTTLAVTGASTLTGAVTASASLAVGTNSFVRGYSSKKITVAAKTTTTTLTASEIIGGLITANQGAGGAATYTLPTGTDLQTALGASFATGDSIDFSVTNVSTVAAEDVTVQGNTGTTLLGSGAVASNAAATDKSSGTFRFVKSGTNTFNVYRI